LSNVILGSITRAHRKINSVLQNISIIVLVFLRKISKNRNSAQEFCALTRVSYLLVSMQTCFCPHCPQAGGIGYEWLSVHTIVPAIKQALGI